jgi:hypothetical protein
MDKDEAQRRGLTWLAEIGSYGTVAGPDPSLLLQPANAIRDALRRDGTLFCPGLGRYGVTRKAYRRSASWRTPLLTRPLGLTRSSMVISVTRTSLTQGIDESRIESQRPQPAGHIGPLSVFIFAARQQFYPHRAT